MGDKKDNKYVHRLVKGKRCVCIIMIYSDFRYNNVGGKQDKLH